MAKREERGKPDQRKLEYIPFGGMGEIGKNMAAFRYEDEILMVDGGLAFPDADMLGVDILVPKIDWVVEHAQQIKGWVLTHGHEDHIGGLPYMLKQLPKIPMYGAKLTLGLLRGKFEEFRLKEAAVDLREVSPDERIKIGQHFTVDMFRMTHSIPDNSGMVIHTPIGRIVYTGDFKLDYHPADGQTSHLAKIAEAGRDGVLMLISDSTNAERPGITPSEHDVKGAIAQIMAKATGRVIVTTFSSHIHRLQNIITIAEQHDRRIVMEGRSMIKVARIAQELGYLKLRQPFVESDKLDGIQDDKLLFLCTGSQGQPMAALSRLASGTHRKITLKRGDTVIMSSNPIPGNEEAVNRVVNALYERDIAVFYPPTYKVHTSGHASQEELKLVFDLARPRFFIPWHGEPRHQVNHLRLAESMPCPPKKTLIPRNGDVVTITKDDIRVTGQVEAGVIYIDSVGKSADEIDEPIIRDRQILAEEGIVVIMAVASRNPSVEVLTRGVAQGNNGLIKELERIALEAVTRGVKEKRRLQDIRDDIFYPVRRHLRKATGRNPLILPTVLEG
ncbi:MAG: ribonuclease J [bacterium]|nr:ribonuclease J [bacterium]